MSYRELWASLLPPQVVIAETELDVARAGAELEAARLQLVGPERELAADFGPTRLLHFVAGRRCARRALAQLGIRGAETMAILRHGQRPVWPGGITGSISHTSDYCAAAVATSEQVTSLGIDVERISRLKQPVAERVAAPGELEGFPAGPMLEWAAVMFSAKEAFYKLQHPLTGVFLGFHDARVSIDPGGELEVELLVDAGELRQGSRFSGRFARTGEHVLTAMVVR